MQAYSDPKRANDPHALPDVNLWLHTHGKRELCWLNDPDGTDQCITDDEGDCLGSGWYWQTCFPGCLPDCDPIGPFATEAVALADAQSDCDDFDDTEAEADDSIYCAYCGKTIWEDVDGWRHNHPDTMPICSRPEPKGASDCDDTCWECGAAPGKPHLGKCSMP